MFIFPGKDAETLFAQTFKGGNFDSLRGCYSGVRVRQYLLEVTAWAHGSKTAKNLLEKVHDSNKEVYLVGMKGGFQAFSNEEQTSSGEKVAIIFVDLDAQLRTKVRNPHNLHAEPISIVEDVAMHNNVAFLHEVGHAKQWIENPGFFMGGVQNTNAFAKQIFNKAMAMSASGDDNAPQRRTDLPAWKAGALYNKAMRSYAENHPVFGGIGSPNSPGWSVRIETDNMSRHEWPICEELGLPKRLNYRDLTIA